jgi:glycosyltransferase involved in cell wall biosynthesis
MVSIIIPTYNEEAYLPRLLASIKAQDYRDREVIVADNGSKDRTRAIAKKFGARVVRGGLPGVGRNRGAASASGEYLMFLDADTVLPEGFITKLMARFEKDFVDVCVPWIRPIDGTKPIYRTIFQFSNTFFKLMEAIQPQGLGICILVTRRLHDRIGGFAENIRVSEDFDYINRASLVGRFRVYSHVFVYHSVRRYRAEGVGTLVQKQFKSGFIYLFTGKAHETDDYEFGTFSRYLPQERNGRGGKDPAEVEKLLSSFDRQSRRLRTEIEKLEKDAAPAAADGGRPGKGAAATKATRAAAKAAKKATRAAAKAAKRADPAPRPRAKAKGTPRRP